MRSLERSIVNCPVVTPLLLGSAHRREITPLAGLWPFVSYRGRVRWSPVSAKRGDLKMRTLPTTMIQVLAPFAPLFSKSVFQHVQVLLAGAILAPGNRTVTSALRA